MDLHFRDLGPLLVESDGAAEPVGGIRLEHALALLLIHAGRPVAVDALAEAVWGEEGVDRSASTLDSHVWRLRRRLEPGRSAREAATVLLREPGGYRLAIAPDQADSLRFAQLAHDAAALVADGDPDQAVRVAESALRLWRGRPYGRSADHDWARPAVARLEEIRGALRETYVGALLATGAADRALAELETLLAEEPLRERLWAARITAYQRTGRRSEAMQAYGEARSLLVTELGVEPGADLQALHAELLRDEPAAPSDSGDPATAPPPPRNRLIGRDRELAAARERLGPGRLLTVVGTAGCGKTRLASEIAARVRFADGVVVVDLTAASPGRVLDTVVSALGAPFATGDTDLARYAAVRQLLLVLDNCEHVLDEVAELVGPLLGSRSTVLATSREPLDVDGEQVLALDPLPIAAAVELLTERLPSVPEDAAAVREIAVALDGLPLALELAAGRARAYTLAEIAQQVRTDASTLSRIGRSRVGRGRGTAHHRTVFDAVDTSYRDLPPSLAALHRAVGAVPGPFTAELAAGLLGVRSAAVVDDIAALAHRSLITPLGPARAGGVSRFGQFATVRGHAAQSAARAGEDPAAARDAWVEGLARSRPPLGSAAQAGWYRALDDDLAALRATLHHTLVEEPSASGVAIAARTNLFWAFHGMALEGMGWLEAADRRPTGAPADRALLHLALGCELLVRGRVAEGADRIRAGIAEGAELTGSDAVTHAECLVVATGPLRVTGQDAVLAEVATAVRALVADGVLVQHAELVRDMVADPRPALIPALVSLHDAARAADNHHTAWSAAAGAARLLLAYDRPTEALPLTRAALHASARTGLRDNLFVMELYGTALALVGEEVPALRALGAAEAQLRGTGRPWPPDDTVADLLTRLTERVGTEAAARARAEGARATVAQFVS